MVEWWEWLMLASVLLFGGAWIAEMTYFALADPSED